ncbi:hypothetical protein Zm00014a_044374 [Zea mays]|uniref:Endonuclease V n=1 Tax=Zea mays TaxID=4577 RepID=A0A3L6E972_MAIZE|nr:Endonuclease V [Zea mays]PWZ17500.1 hypothetical protein Zm00014a_044374 [Zea mays]
MDDAQGYQEGDDHDLVMQKQDGSKHKTCSRVNLFLKMNLPGVYLRWAQAPVLLGLLEKVKINAPHFCPQLLMVDGNGLLHPRASASSRFWFSLSSRSVLLVLADIPTIGVGKNLHQVDGLNQSEVRRQLGSKENCNRELVLLTGQSGTKWGMAMRSCPGSSKPIYVLLAVVEFSETNM